MSTKTNIFSSSLKEQILDFVNFRNAQGYKYTGGTDKIRGFDKFLESEKFERKILTPSIIENYISYLSQFSANTKCNRFSIVKEFSSYLKILHPESHLIVRNIFRRPPTKKSYIFTDEEIRSLLSSTKKYRNAYPIYSITNYTIIGLLVFTGMRIQECLNLNLEHWDNVNSTFFIKKGKFGKDRIIPVSPSVHCKIENYMEKRLKHKSTEYEKPLFINRKNKRVKQDAFRYFFNKLLDELQIKSKSFEVRKPIIHSLRHTFAVKNILKWLNAGENINNMLPYLSTYMGHISLSSTQVYLQSIKEMKIISSKKFHRLFQNNI